MLHHTVIKINQYDNFVGKIDLQQKAFDNLLTIDMGLFGSSQKNNGIFDVQRLFYSAAGQNPTYLAGMNANGGYDKNTTASQINPPQVLLKEKNDEKSLNFNSHLRFSVNLATDLRLILFGSYSYNSIENGQFFPTWIWAQGQAFRKEHKSEDWLANATFNYAHTWGIHHLDATLLGEYQKNKSTAFWTLVNEFGYHNLGAGSIRPYGGTGSSYEDPSLASVMGGISYTLWDKYSLSFNTRADGSSMVGDHNTWGFFPSVSAEWDVKKEPFLRKAEPMEIAYGIWNVGQFGRYPVVHFPQARVCHWSRPQPWVPCRDLRQHPQ